MAGPHWENLKEIFHAAVALPSNKRAAYLDQACGGDPSLRGSVESLLKSHQETRNFVDAPAYQAAADMLTHDDEHKAGQTIAHYRIRSLLGSGGMGKVYLAEDTKLKRNVALKVLPSVSARDEAARKRLLREARAAAALDHPNICGIHEVGDVDGIGYIAMQYIDGETLDMRLKRGPLSCDESLAIAVQIADALAEAHARKL
ncbi:MAG: protein kinase, partial [Acidobacteriota bacterium]|nr:protein kinase [Acidobacteriota bacterium]